jgi:hypothetical protein
MKNIKLGKVITLINTRFCSTLMMLIPHDLQSLCRKELYCGPQFLDSETLRKSLMYTVI